jgi:hypothetical protein
MYSYNLIVKTSDDGDSFAQDALVNRELTRRFGPDVLYHTHARLSHEIVVIVSGDSKRNFQTVLGEWFVEGSSHRETTSDYATYPVGTLLHYREILRDEPTHILNKIGGSAND